MAVMRIGRYSGERGGGGPGFFGLLGLD